MVHGWGMNHSIWQPLQNKLPDWVDCRAVDLPGHGLRAGESFVDLHSLCQDLLAQCRAFKKEGQPLVLVGWSLGALPCLQLAIDQLAQIDGLLLVSSSPCFVSRPGWSAGVEEAIFDQFSESLKSDFSGTIRRFLSLQVKGSESARGILRSLREKVLQQPKPNQVSLDAGLEILKRVDLSTQLQKINAPVSWALGAQDGLVKITLADELKTLMPLADVRQYSKAAHAVFLSHTDAFAQQLIKFLIMVSNER
ncbi:Biotin synthesis protein BioH [hydrothermal vent metagenome]|uniref:Biotin synthesis protein BioH n=1 Tax=hydrothermal vent metagenome TaxID=652676 RepID=A0A3B0XWT3_9ZZZZ